MIRNRSLSLVRGIHTRCVHRSPALLVADVAEGSCTQATLAAVKACEKFGDVHVLVAGGQVSGASEMAQRIAGVSKVLRCEHASLDHELPERVAPVVAGLAKSAGYSHVVFAATSTGKSTMPRVAGLLDVMPVSDVTEVVSEDTFVRPIYAGNAMSTVKSSSSPKVLSVRATSFAKAALGDSPKAAAEDVSADAAASVANTSAWVEDKVKKSDRPELSAAKRVVSGGRALKSKENFAIIEQLADALGAAVGASRAAVDAGYAPNEWQVGQTGKVVAPELYVAAGISGQIQHLAGMKDSKCIVAINTDIDAPIFQVADYGLVEDLFNVVPELTKKVSK